MRRPIYSIAIPCLFVFICALIFAGEPRIASAQLQEIYGFLRQEYPSVEISEKFRHDLGSFFAYEEGPDDYIAFVEASADTTRALHPGRVNIFGCDGLVSTIQPAELPAGQSVYETEIFQRYFPKTPDSLEVAAGRSIVSIRRTDIATSCTTSPVVWEKMLADSNFGVFKMYGPQFSTKANIIILPGDEYMLAYDLDGNNLWSYDYPDDDPNRTDYPPDDVYLAQNDGTVVIVLRYGNNKIRNVVLLSRDGEEISQTRVNASHGIFFNQTWGPLGFHDNLILIRFLITENAQRENATLVMAGDRRNPTVYLVRGFWHLLDGCNPNVLIGAGRKEPLVRAFALPE